MGCVRSFSAVGHGEKLRKRMATDRGLGRFVAELGPIVYLPGGGSSWRKKYPIAFGGISAKELTVVFTLTTIDD